MSWYSLARVARQICFHVGLARGGAEADAKLEADRRATEGARYIWKL